MIPVGPPPTSLNHRKPRVCGDDPALKDTVRDGVK